MENMRNFLVPENKMQWFWEQNGRVKATLEWAKREICIDKKTLIAMLSSEPMPCCTNAFSGHVGGAMAKELEGSGTEDKDDEGEEEDFF